MKRRYFCFLLSLLAISAMGQVKESSRNFIGLGMSQVDYRANKKDELQLAEEEFLAIDGTYEWVHEKNFALGVEAQLSIRNEVKAFNARLKIGYLINGRHRLQFPLFAYLGIGSLQEIDKVKYGASIYSAMTGIRFYVSDRLSFQALYNLNLYNITTENGKSKEDSIGQLTTTDYRLGIVLYLKSK